MDQTSQVDVGQEYFVVENVVRHGAGGVSLVYPLFDSFPFVSVPVGGDNRILHQLMQDWTTKLNRFENVLKIILH